MRNLLKRLLGIEDEDESLARAGTPRVGVPIVQQDPSVINPPPIDPRVLTPQWNPQAADARVPSPIPAPIDPAAQENRRSINPVAVAVDSPAPQEPRVAIPINTPTDLGGGSTYTSPNPDDRIFREREVSPTPLLTRLSDYGQQLRDQPAEKPSRLRGFFEGLRRGGIIGGVSGAIDPGPFGEYQKRKRIAENDEAVKQEREAQEFEVNRDYKRAAIPYMLARPDLERDKIAQKSAYDQWRMKSGDRKADTYDNWIKWKMENGDRTATSLEDYRKWQQDFGERRFEETKRHNVAGEDIARQNSELSARRTAAYEYAARNGGVGKQAQVAADTAEADYWESEADAAEAEAAAIDRPTVGLAGEQSGMTQEEMEEVQRLRKQAREFRRKAGLKKARLGASAPPQTKPSPDPLDLFK